jgi:recombination associated protein RdgC
MFFRNLAIYKLPSGWSRTADEIGSTLAEFPLRPCASQAMQSRGWIPVNDAGELVYGQGQQLLIALGVDEKLLPAAVINQTADDRIHALEQQNGFKIGRKHRREIKEQVQADLLPRALSRRRVTLGWLDFDGGWLVVDTSTPSRADEFTQGLRIALGELPATPLLSEPSMSALMTQWLSSKQAPGAFDLDDECELTATDEHKSTVRYLHHSLDGTDITGHLSQGKVTTRLSLVWNGRISLLINDKLQVKKLKFLDVERIQEEQNDELDQFAVDFALMSGELRGLLNDLARAINCPEVSGE